ncbi:MAG: 30S ribosome-binding factor RbfA [Actinomycetota bacterium]
MSVRTERLAETLREVIMDIIQKDLKDPAIGIASVTHIRVSPDLKHAWISLSVFGDDQTKEDTLKAFAKASGHIRSELGKRVRLRYLPELVFTVDEGIEQSFKVAEILRGIKRENREEDVS